MNDQLWSWVLGLVGVAGFVLAGKKIWWSWYVNIGAQFLWGAYAILTEQYGFLVSSLVYFVVFSKNAHDWTQEHHQKRIAEGVVSHDRTYSDSMAEGIAMANKARESLGKSQTGYRFRGSFEIPLEVLNQPGETTGAFVDGYFKALEKKLRTHFVLTTFRDFNLDRVWVEWVSEQPVAGIVDPFGRSDVEHGVEINREELSTPERLLESDQGPVFFSYGDMTEVDEHGKNPIENLKRDLERRAAQLGATYDIRYETKPNGILIHWEWKP